MKSKLIDFLVSAIIAILGGTGVALIVRAFMNN